MKHDHSCGTCAALRAHLKQHFGLYLPWAVLVAGGIASLIPSANPAWDKGSAYLIAGALVWFGASIIFSRLNRRPAH